MLPFPELSHDISSACQTSDGKVELIGGTLPANWKDLILERPEKLRVEYQEVTWQFQSPEALLEVEKNAAAMGQNKNRFELGAGHQWMMFS